MFDSASLEWHISGAGRVMLDQMPWGFIKMLTLRAKHINMYFVF
jgi:hypothetical protein